MDKEIRSENYISEIVKEQKASRAIVSENVENSNPQYQKIDELLQEYKQKYPESSLGISEDTRIEIENVFSQIDDYLDNGIVPQERRFTLPKVPSYMKELGSDETAISLPVSVIKKARETHGLSNEEIKNSLTRLYDPVAVFDTDKTKSENRLDSKLILTDEFSESKPIALALNTNSQIQVEEDGHRKFIEVQDIRSIHDRTLTAKNGTDLVKQWTENGLCRYVDDKKISEWSTVARVYFPIEALHSDKNNILTKSEIVKEHGILRYVDDKKISNLGKEREDSFLLPLAKLDINNVKTYSDFVNQHGIVAENESEYHKANEKELEQWYETVDWEDPMESAEAWQNGTQEQIAYIRKRRNEKIIDNGRLDDISELQEALKDALKQVAVPLEKIEFTRDNYNKLFPYSKIETPIENVKMGEHQFEKLEEKERQNILLAVHDTLKTPDVIINEKKENVFGENEDNHIYAKSFLIDDKVHGVQSVVVSIDGENVSISTHERSINNIVNKIKKPDQLLYAAAKVRLLVEQHTELPQSVVNPIRENEYVVSPQLNVQQKADSVKQETNPAIKKSQIDFNKEIQNQIQEKKMENKMNQESELNIGENGNEVMFDNPKSETENRKSIKAIDVWNEIYEAISENPEYKTIKFETLDYLYNKGTDDAAGYDNSFERNIHRLEEIGKSDKQLQQILEKYKDFKIDFDDKALTVKIAGTRNNNFNKAKQNLLDFVESKKYLRESEINQKQEFSLFDKELYLFNNGQLDENHVFNLGKPGEILKNCGFPGNDRIELVASRLKIKASQGNHPFEIMDILGLDKALQNPIAVFEYGEKEKAQNVIVNLEKDGKNFLAGVFFNQKKDGFEVSSIRELFNRDNLDWMRWIQQGKMIYGDKERIQVLANQQRTNLADVNSKEARTISDLYYLDSLDNILQNFAGVKNIYTRDFPRYTEQKEKFEIFKQFRTAYQETDSINIYDAVKDADEFYKAIKNNDKSIIEKFTNGIEKAELASVASLILENGGSHVQLKGINTQALNSNYSKDTLLSIKKIQGQLKSQDEIIDRGIESVQSNVGMSEAAMEAEIAAQNNASYESEEEYSDEIDTFFYDTNGNPNAPQKIIAVLENFQKIEPSKWNLPAEEKTAVFHLMQLTEIDKNDFENSLAKLQEYMNTEEFNREDENYAKIFTPILLTSLGQDFDKETHTFSSEKFSFKFSTDDLKIENPIKKGEIKSISDNDFTGSNIKLTQEFQDELIEKGLVEPEEKFVLINEVEAVAKGTKIKADQPAIVLTIPVDNNGKTEFVQTKYYHVSALEDPQKLEMTVEENSKSKQVDKDVIIYGKTKVPEFATITQHGLENFTDMIIDSYEESTNSYLLKSEDGKKNVRVTENTLKVLTSEEYVKKSEMYTQNTKTAEKMIDTQYNDFFQSRDNTANNFRHNLSVFCRKEANSPLDALKVANSLISQMSKEEKQKTKELLKLLRKDGQTVNEVLIETYHEAVKETPLNEDYIKHNRYEKMIARPMYDTLSNKGEKIDRDFNLKIGDSVDITFKVNRNPGSKFSLRKESIYQNCTIISASKEGNVVTLMDGNKSFYDVPRDTFLNEYAKKENLKNKVEKKVNHQKSMQIDIER